MDKTSLVQVVSLATASALFSEAVAWLLIFRKPEYHRLMGSLENAQKRLDKKKEMPEEVKASKEKVAKEKDRKKDKEKDTNKSKMDKRLVMLEKEVEATNRDLTIFKMRANMATAVVLMLTFWSLKSNYEGVVLARLPFEPFAIVRGLSHRGLEGEDMRECGVIFVYVLCCMTIKPNLQRALGHMPPKPQIPKTIFGISTDPYRNGALS